MLERGLSKILDHCARLWTILDVVLTVKSTYMVWFALNNRNFFSYSDCAYIRHRLTGSMHLDSCSNSILYLGFEQNDFEEIERRQLSPYPLAFLRSSIMPHPKIYQKQYYTLKKSLNSVNNFSFSPLRYTWGATKNNTLDPVVTQGVMKWRIVHTWDRWDWQDFI